MEEHDGQMGWTPPNGIGVPEFRYDARFSSWLYRITINLSRNWRKRPKRREQVLSEWSGQQMESASSPSGCFAQVQVALI